MSDRSTGIATLEERMDDIRAVMDAEDSERAVIFGLSEGVPLAALFATTYPERTQGLMLWGGSATYVQQPDYPWVPPLEQHLQEIAEDEVTLFERWGTHAYAQKMVRYFNPSTDLDNELIAWFAGLMRLGASPGAALARVRMNLTVDVRSILSTVRAPTLVLTREGDPSATLEEAQYLADHIPGAELVVLPGDEHFPWLGDQASVFTAVASFLARRSGDIVTIDLTRSEARTLRDLLVRRTRMGQPAAIPVEAEEQALSALERALAAELGESTPVRGGNEAPTG